MSDPDERMQIPPTLRAATAEAVAVSREACAQLSRVAQAAQAAALGEQNRLAADLIDVGGAALVFAEANVEAGFEAAACLARAPTVGEFLELQQAYTSRQVEALSRQIAALGEMFLASAAAGQRDRRDT